MARCQIIVGTSGTLAPAEDQETHHIKKTFIEEYEEFLKKFNIEYEQKYIFKEPV